MNLTSSDNYQQLLEKISRTYTQGRIGAMQAVNAQLIQTYWQVGRHIVEFEQGGKIRADYGKALLASLAKDLGLRHGKGFSRSNLIRVRQFYLAYPIGATASHLLSWSHIVELLKIEDPLERSFYEQQCVRERWSVRELIRQNVGWVRRGFLRRNPTNLIFLQNVGSECLGLLGYAIKPLTQPT